MTRCGVACVVFAFIVAVAGCRVCSHPYDYCGPVYDGPWGHGGNPQARAGSILSGAAAMPGAQVVSEEAAVETDPTTAPAAGGAQIAEPAAEPLPPQTTQQSTGQSTEQAGPKLAEPTTRNRWVARSSRSAAGPVLSASSAVR